MVSEVPVVAVKKLYGPLSACGHCKEVSWVSEYLWSLCRCCMHPEVPVVAVKRSHELRSACGRCTEVVWSP